MHLEAIDTASLKGWPALEESFYDGWVLRFSKGYTKRANSVNAIGSSTKNIQEKVRYCESFYRSLNLPSIFRITPFISPKNLDTILEGREYEVLDPTWVLTRNLIDLEFQPAVHRLVSAPLNEWEKIFCALRGVPLNTHLTHQEIISAIPTPKLFATLQYRKQPVACGVGSIVDGLFGMFDLFTDPNQRRKGFGQSLVLGMLSWAQEHGARWAYLQAVKRNIAALSLYRKLGFKKKYSYWYRKLEM